MTTDTALHTSTTVLHRTTPVNLRDMHACEGLLRCCIDFRFWPDIMEYVEAHFLTRGKYDLDPNAGGVKDIIDKAVQEHGVKGILISCRLHSMRKIILVAHEDCGAYGGSKEFNSREEEKTFHVTQLHQACDIIREILRTKGDGCYDEHEESTDKEFILLWAGISDDGTHVKIERLPNTK